MIKRKKRSYSAPEIQFHIIEIENSITVGSRQVEFGGPTNGIPEIETPGIDEREYEFEF